MTQISGQAIVPTEQKHRVVLSWADAGMLVVALIWGANFTVVKQTLVEVSPMTFVSLRFLIASLCLIGILIGTGENLRVAKKDIIPILLIAILGHTGYQVMFIKGIALTSASNSALLLATSPIFVALIGVVLRTEHVTRAIAAGIALSFAGTVLIVGLGSGGVSAALDTLPGNVISLGAAACWALNTVWSKPLLERYSPLKLTTVTVALATPFLLAVGSSELQQQQWSQVSLQGWLGLVFSAIFANGVAYILWNLSVQKAGSTRTAVFSNLVPVIAIAVSGVVLGEKMGIWQGIGAAVTLAGVTLTRLRPRRGAARLLHR